MPRYFIEVCYKGTNYSGFQIQKNANSIQAEVEKALKIFFKKDFLLTGSSRTDAGVHALQNYFHFDVKNSLSFDNDQAAVYNLNSLLPFDIAIKKIFPVKENAHCRFNAISREYKYFIYQEKNPFLQDTAYYYPYKLDIEKLNVAAGTVKNYNDFTSFSKTRTQVKNFICKIEKSEWLIEDEKIIYTVIANRFLRGMVKGLVGTMLRSARNKLTLKEYTKIIENKDSSRIDFSPPSKGLLLNKVSFESDILCL